MIRINLLGQARPKAAKTAVPVEATMQALMAIFALAAAIVVLGIIYYNQTSEYNKTEARITALKAEKASLQQVKQDVTRFESQKSTLQQRIDVIETLQKNRSGGQDLLQMVANTVVRVDELWLTSLTRTGNSIDVQGEAGSISAVANFITQMKRSGYFDNVEIKDAKENDVRPGVETFGFSMSASINPAGQAAASGQPQPASSPAPASAKGGTSRGL
ncbi:MAG TPA: PilN domain-containing protein [Candidatus Binatia bacterium]|jgi:type IV pilus assembly protein PilN|nr:PilN domain-containing protein [Candidatus Acidoferrales bacterium]HXU48055.1 PilN domain-containing protein [Candidatus Binatia bacterium]